MTWTWRKRLLLIAFEAVVFTIIMLAATVFFRDNTIGAEEPKCDQHAGMGECLVPPPTPVPATPSFTG